MGLLKNLTLKRCCLFVTVAVLAYALMNYSATKELDTEGHQQLQGSPVSNEVPNQGANLAQMQEGEQKVQNGAPVQAGELFPRGESMLNDAQVSPSLSGQTGLLDVQQQIGTVSTSNRNPNYQLRRDIPVEQKQVSPWNNTTIQQDEFNNGLSE